MSSLAISVENLSKRYIIGHQRNARDGLRHALEDAFRNPFKWLMDRKRQLREDREEFWALKDVTFQIQQGDVVGIIGRNGAGKSTLLKVLSRITEPTEGRICIKGRVASLLEVGTGFHQELTGRENIYLNGAILGMSKAEIKRKFDEIVAFSEIEKFLDTPVKRYSSGMYVRLAFAVAAHLEPEILIVDEVLAVGDIQFQKKCLGKMENVANQGRTVLFVSHNMAAIRQLCKSGLLLQQGRVQSFGGIQQVTESYLKVGVKQDGHWIRSSALPDRDGISFLEVKTVNLMGQSLGQVDCTESFALEILFRVRGSLSRAQIAVRFTNQDGIILLTTCNTDTTRTFQRLEPGIHRYRVNVPPGLLAPGLYTLQIAAHVPRMEMLDLIDNTISLNVDETGSLRSLLQDDRLGIISPTLKWERVTAADEAAVAPVAAPAIMPTAAS